MSSGFAESHVEEAALAWLAELGYATANGLDIGPDGSAPERASYGDVLLIERVRAAIAKLNPALASRNARRSARASCSRPRRRRWSRRTAACIATWSKACRSRSAARTAQSSGEQVRLIDFDDPDANDWLAVNQFTVIENKANRRPDVVIFVNGLPLGVIELKNPGDENATLDGAFNQLQTYKAQIASLFRTNAALVISDGIAARIGSLTADRERFMPWRTVTGDDLAPKGTPELETVLKGVFDRRRFLDLVKDFIVFGDTGSDVVKILAGYHQFHAVRHAVAAHAGRDRARRRPQGRGDLAHARLGQEPADGVLCRPDHQAPGDGEPDAGRAHRPQRPRRPAVRHLQHVQGPAAPDAATGRGPRRPAQAARPAFGRRDLHDACRSSRPKTGTTDYPVLTDRRNVIVIADEAHRSQYGFEAKVERKTGEISYGFAKYLRDALPNASFIGFTGTPIEKDDVNTPAVFGDYIDIYDISRAVEDGATVPIYYESRLARIELDEDEKPKIDAEIADLTEDEAADRAGAAQAQMGERRGAGRLGEAPRPGRRGPREALRGPDRRRSTARAMIVCMSRRICVALYDAIVKLRPEWHSDDDEAGAIKVVMTGAASDPPAWQPHIGKRPKARRELLAKRAKNAEGPAQARDRARYVADRLRRALHAHDVCRQADEGARADAGHRPRQPRVPRQARRAGRRLHRRRAEPEERARRSIRSGDREQTGIDEARGRRVLLEKYEIVRAMFRPDTKGGFDYRPALDADATPQAAPCRSWRAPSTGC